MKSIVVELPRYLSTIKIKVFSDWHLGDRNCNMNKILEEIKEVKESNDTYCIINGDIINNDTKTSVGDIYSQEMSPMEQIKRAVELLLPIKDKILVVTRGNHEDRTYRQDGIDLMCFLVRELGIESRYSPVAAVLFLRFGQDKLGRKETNKSGETRRLCYTFYITHGASGGRTVGAKSNALQREGDVVENADVYIISHTHQPITFRDGYYEIDTRNSNVIYREKIYVNSGSMLGYDNSYAEKLGLRPSSVHQPMIILNGTVREVNVIS